MASHRRLRDDVKRSIYATILDAAPIGDRAALRDARGPKAETVFEHERRVGRKICRVFTTSGGAPKPSDVCERCPHTYELHRMKWYS